jgi:2-polyprenyl-3-methyl-5-hydroxy-6-metoxy-1,4-benzoquinol methylase
MQCALLGRHLAPGSRILEIGCGRGLLLRCLKEAGYDTQGIEPSESASRAARDAGLKVTQGYFKGHDFRGQTFDAVIMSHVLEHVERPGPLIDEAAGVAPGGLLLLVQANWRGLVPLKTKELWHAWAIGHHYWHFTPGGLATWLRGKGIKQVDLEYSSLEHGDYWLARLSAWLPRASDQFHLLSRFPPH